MTLPPPPLPAEPQQYKEWHYERTVQGQHQRRYRPPHQQQPGGARQWGQPHPHPPPPPRAYNGWDGAQAADLPHLSPPPVASVAMMLAEGYRGDAAPSARQAMFASRALAAVVLMATEPSSPPYDLGELIAWLLVDAQGSCSRVVEVLQEAERVPAPEALRSRILRAVTGLCDDFREGRTARVVAFARARLRADAPVGGRGPGAVLSSIAAQVQMLAVRCMQQLAVFVSIREDERQLIRAAGPRAKDGPGAPPRAGPPTWAVASREYCVGERPAGALAPVVSEAALAEVHRAALRGLLSAPGDAGGLARRQGIDRLMHANGHRVRITGDVSFGVCERAERADGSTAVYRHFSLANAGAERLCLLSVAAHPTLPSVSLADDFGAAGGGRVVDLAPGAEYCVTLRLERGGTAAGSSLYAEMWVLFTFAAHEGLGGSTSALSNIFVVGRRASYCLVSRPKDYASIALSVEAGASSNPIPRRPEPETATLTAPRAPPLQNPSRPSTCACSSTCARSGPSSPSRSCPRAAICSRRRSRRR